MLSSKRDFTAPESLTVELTPDLTTEGQESVTPLVRTYLTIHSEGVLVESVFPDALTQSVAISHTQMGLLCNAWKTVYEYHCTANSPSDGSDQMGHATSLPCLQQY